MSYHGQLSNTKHLEQKLLEVAINDHLTDLSLSFFFVFYGKASDASNVRYVAAAGRINYQFRNE